jgi:hypothetical protein
VTRYVLADLRQTGDELARRAAELTAWLDREATAHDPDRPPEVAVADLACVRAVSAAAHRLTAAAASVAACAGAMREADGEIARRLCGWSG